MKHILILRLSLFLAISVCMPTRAEQTLTATCSELSGTKSALIDGKATTTPVTQVAPIFFVDSGNPTRLVSLWKAKLFDKETTDKYEATIIELSDGKLQAIEKDANGIYSYTLFFDHGTLLYSHHRLHSFFDKGPTLLSFVGQCELKIARPSDKIRPSQDKAPARTGANDYGSTVPVAAMMAPDQGGLADFD